MGQGGSGSGRVSDGAEKPGFLLFKGAAERAGGLPSGRAQGRLLCWNARVASQRMSRAGRSKGNLKITGRPQSVPLNEGRHIRHLAGAVDSIQWSVTDLSWSLYHCQVQKLRWLLGLFRLSEEICLYRLTHTVN